MSPEEKTIQRLLRAVPAKPAQPGEVIKLRDGSRYRVGKRGNWIKLPTEVSHEKK